VYVSAVLIYRRGYAFVDDEMALKTKWRRSARERLELELYVQDCSSEFETEAAQSVPSSRLCGDFGAAAQGTFAVEQQSRARGVLRVPDQ
jgi:hypothetical protein